MHALLMWRFVDVAILVLLQIQNAKAGGNLKIALLSYAISYQTEEGTTSPPVINNATVADEYANSYKAQWNISGVFTLDRRPENANSQNTANISVEAWPWDGVAECSNNTLYRFLICLDYVSSFDPQRPCALQRLQTEPVPTDRAAQHPAASDVEIISFNNYFRLSQDNQTIISNPLKIRYPDWKGAVRLAVYIDCCSENSKHKERCKEMLSTTIDLTPRTFLEGSLTIRRALSGRGSLIVSFGASCEPDYYSPSCDVHCHIDNAFTDHRFCNVSNGRKQCLPGWSGPDCQVDMNECEVLICQNGATCVNRPGTFFCSCLLGTMGRLCKRRIPVCHLRPCQNGGTCLETQANSVCFCTSGFTGPICQFQLQEHYELTTLIESTQTSTTLNLVAPVLTSTLETVGVAPSKELNQKGEGQWQNWYLAVILGGGLLLALIVTVVVLQRFNLTSGYKVTLSFSSSRRANALRSPRQEINNVSNKTYHADNDDVVQTGVFNVFHNSNNANNDATDSDENIIFDKAACNSKTENHTSIATSVNTNCVNDYLYLCSGAVSSTTVENVRFSSTTTLEVKANKKKQRKHKHSKRTGHTGHQYTDLIDLPVFTKPSQEHHEGPYAVSSCFNEHLGLSKRKNSKSILLTEEAGVSESAIGNRNGSLPSVGVKSTWETKEHFRSNENEYEEIDLSHTSRPYQLKLAHKYAPSIERKSFRQSRLWLRAVAQGAENREDDGGYLVPRALTASSLDIHVVDTEHVPSLGIYDYPRLKDGNIKDIHNTRSLFRVPQGSNEPQTLSNNGVSISHISLSPNTSFEDWRDNDTSPIYSIPKDYNTGDNSTEQLYVNSTYVNTSI